MLDLGRVQRAQSTYDQSVGQKQALELRQSSLQSEISELKGHLESYGKVLAVFHEMSQTLHGQFLHGIEELVTEGLTAVFGREIEFKIIPTIRGKSVNLDFQLLADGVQSDDLVASHGGGLVSVAGVILRLIVLRFLREEHRQTAFLDEPLAHLSEEFIQPCGELLSKLAEQLDIQIVMVSHQPEFAEFADKVIRLERKDGATVCITERTGT